MPSPDALPQYLATLRTRVDRALDAYLPKPPAAPPLLVEAMRYSLMAGGKRLRPILTLATADAVSRDEDRTSLALPAACAVEFVHTYSLIHDDLPAMDNDTLRRGRPTLHVVYGEAIAILAGDALQAEAFALLAREPSAADPDIARRRLATGEVIARAAGAAGMVGGQVVDVQAAGQAIGRPLVLDASSLQEMHRQKTGALIRASATSGAIMAGADEETTAAVDAWAAQIGLAFQIVDDILDVEGDQAELGKSPGKDAGNDKPTYPALFGVERSRQMAVECTARARSILGQSRLADGWLDALGQWVLTRTN